MAAGVGRDEDADSGGIADGGCVHGEADDLDVFDRAQFCGLRSRFVGAKDGLLEGIPWHFFAHAPVFRLRAIQRPATHLRIRVTQRHRSLRRCSPAAPRARHACRCACRCASGGARFPFPPPTSRLPLPSFYLLLAGPSQCAGTKRPTRAFSGRGTKKDYFRNLK